MKELDIEAVKDNITEVLGFIDEQLESTGCSPKTLMQIDLAAEEIFVNIAEYAYDPETGPATVRVEVKPDGSAVIITFIDHGVPYDPLAKEDPDVTLSAAERKVGGLGIFLVKKNMDNIKYEYVNGSNILTIIKKLS
ncbi:MAG TPA: ATP-binding protein [Ruminococcus sp.]|nr:ATP-binding protein [Ruminococcus sp.]HPY83690.1 ATP-binding protein [Ruminococcus flavefaciens]HRU96116.1 ATP-binding protein [Ruminococcus sp.]